MSINSYINYNLINLSLLLVFYNNINVIIVLVNVPSTLPTPVEYKSKRINEKRTNTEIVQLQEGEAEYQKMHLPKKKITKIIQFLFLVITKRIHDIAVGMQWS